MKHHVARNGMNAAHGWRSRAGVTLVEAMVAIVVMIVAVLGASLFLFHSHSAVNRASQYATASEACASRLEDLTTVAYEDLSSYAETDTPILLEGTEATRSTEVASIDEDVDGEDDYAQVTVSIDWTQANGLDQQVQIVTFRSQ